MADPFSVAVGVVSVITAAQVAERLKILLDSVQGPPLIITPHLRNTPSVRSPSRPV